MTKNEKVIQIRQSYIDRICAEKELIKNLAHHLSIDVSDVRNWLTEYYSDEMIKSIIVSLDRLEKAKENTGSVLKK